METVYPHSFAARKGFADLLNAPNAQLKLFPLVRNLSLKIKNALVCTALVLLEVLSCITNIQYIITSSIGH